MAVLLVSMGAKVRSPNFIVEHPDPQFANQVARAAEQYRSELAVSWLGQAMPNWSAPCQMTVETGPRLGAGGATTFIFDRGEVYGWRMTIQGSRQRILDSVLPHEVTHMIFASHFRQPVPRWADEGGATSVEHPSERMKHRRMLVEFLRTGRGLSFNRMFALKEYPRDIMPLYAQGYSVAEYLIQGGGRRKYIAFLDDAMDSGDWSGAIRRHYDVDGAGALQNRWLAWVQQGSPAFGPQLLADRGGSPAPTGSVYSGPSQPQPRGGSEGAMPSLAAVRPSPGQLSTPVVPAAARGADLALARSDAEVLPESGWRPAGSLPMRSTEPERATAMASRTQAVPRGSHVTRPQSPYPARQVILEWSRQ